MLSYEFIVLLVLISLCIWAGVRTPTWGHKDLKDRKVHPYNKVHPDNTVHSDNKVHPARAGGCGGGIPHYSNSSSGHYKADTGYVYPYVVTCGDIVIKPFQDQPDAIQAAVSDALQSEWGSRYSVGFINESWPDSDVMYVACTSRGDFVGCMAVDRKNFCPFISHLFVAPDLRKQGVGGLFLAVAEKYSRQKLKFDEMKLWCLPHVLPYYTKRGWVEESRDKDDQGREVRVMRKSLG